MSEPEVTLRPVRPDDAAFLLNVYASARAGEMALVPWTDEQKAAFLRAQLEAQTRDYTARYPQAEHHVVLRDGREAGRLFIARDAERIHILDVTVLTGERGAGIGGALIRLLQNEAVGAASRSTLRRSTHHCVFLPIVGSCRKNKKAFTSCCSEDPEITLRSLLGIVRTSMI